MRRARDCSRCIYHTNGKYYLNLKLDPKWYTRSAKKHEEVQLIHALHSHSKILTAFSDGDLL